LPTISSFPARLPLQAQSSSRHNHEGAASRNSGLLRQIIEKIRAYNRKIEIYCACQIHSIRGIKIGQLAFKTLERPDHQVIFECNMTRSRL
jgi:hypothetical protein